MRIVRPNSYFVRDVKTNSYTGTWTLLIPFSNWKLSRYVQALEKRSSRDASTDKRYQWLFVEEIVYYSVHWVMKSAFLFFYLRLSPDGTDFRYAVYAGLGLNTIVWGCNMYVIAFLHLRQEMLTSETRLLACIQCMPFDEILHPGTHPDAYCMNKLVVLLLPCLLVSSLHSILSVNHATNINPHRTSA
jgi:hypothetical protein